LLVGVAILADSVGWGSQSGMGKHQFTLALVGVMVAVSGATICLPFTDERRLRLAIAVASGIAGITAVLYFALSFFGLSVPARMNVFPDDSFYYMTPALNIAKGLGPTADTITRTSGFHPLWMGILVILSWLVQLDKILFFDGVVALGLVFHAVSAFLLYLTGIQFIPRLLALGWALIYLVSIKGLHDAIGGTEASLLALLLAMFLWHETRASHSSISRSLWRGVLMGLLFLARTDTVFFIAGYLLIDAFIELSVCPDKNRNLSGWLKNLAATVVTVFLVILPWLVISWITYGSLFQSSLLIKIFWRSRVLQDASVMEQVKFSVKMYIKWIREIKATYPTTLLFLLSFLGGIVLAQRSLKLEHGETVTPLVSRPLSRLIATVGALLVYSLGAGLFYSICFSFVREWYYVSARILWPVFGILLCAFISANRWHTGMEQLRLLIAIAQGVIVLGMAFTAITYPFSEYGATRGASQFVAMAEYIKEHLPTDAIIGAYSSGILSYFSERRVVNLDGLANVDILEVASSRRMDQYLDALGVTWLADHESIIWPDLTVGLLRDGNPEYVKRLREVYRVPCDSKYGDIVLWRVLPKP